MSMQAEWDNRPSCRCEEHHEEDCQVPGWEEAYWARYFGLRSGERQHNKNQLRAFAPYEFDEDD